MWAISLLSLFILIQMENGGKMLKLLEIKALIPFEVSIEGQRDKPNNYYDMMKDNQLQQRDNMYMRQACMPISWCFFNMVSTVSGIIEIITETVS
jgi:hypothetical protein